MDYTEDSAWVAVEGKVYDVTGFLDDVSSSTIAPSDFVSLFPSRMAC